MSQVLRPRLALLLTAALLLGGFALLQAAPPARAGPALVFSEGFESGGLGSRWAIADSDAASGIDTWGVSDFRNNTGSYSAWCAQVGTQSSGTYAGLNNSDPGVQQYDDNMQADLSINLTVSGYASLTLSFWYFAKTESGGGDWIQAWYEAGGVQTSIFTNVGSTGNKWQVVNISVPTNVERLIFRFHSDAANHGFEGAYVDDIVMYGIESVPPTSSVSSLQAYSNTVPTLIPYTAQDNANASGVAYVELWWRLGTTGAFTNYSRPSNPYGQWIASPIPFDPTFAAGDGTYQFYTTAVDRAGNVEAVPASPDATIMIDTQKPSLTINEPANGRWFNTAPVAVSWQATDSLSGMDHYETSLDGAAFVSNGQSGLRSFSGLSEGSHSVVVRAYDLAGNVGEATVNFGVDTTPPALLISAPTSGEIVNVGVYTITWTAIDNTSGIDRYEVRLDEGVSVPTGDLRMTLTGIPDGRHTVHVVAVDRAGNARDVSVEFLVDTNPFSLTGPYRGLPLFLLLAVIIAAMLFLLFWWKRRKDQEEERAGLEATERAEGPEPGAADMESPPEPPEGGT